MNVLTGQTLAQIVTGNHKTAAVFEKYHMDFCCKGKRSLEQACGEHDVPVEELLKELELVDSNDETVVLAELSLTDLSDYIVGTHHSYVNNELPQLLGYAEKVATKHGGRYAELIKVAQALSALKEEMFLHMHKEEVVLFPRIKELESLAEQDHGRVNLSVTYLQAPVRMMEQEHDHAGELMADIRELTHDYTPPMDACTTFRLLYSSLQAFEADLHQHVHIENNILFPRAIRLAKQLSR